MLQIKVPKGGRLTIRMPKGVCPVVNGDCVELPDIGEDYPVRLEWDSEKDIEFTRCSDGLYDNVRLSGEQVQVVYA